MACDLYADEKMKLAANMNTVSHDLMTVSNNLQSMKSRVERKVEQKSCHFTTHVALVMSYCMIREGLFSALSRCILSCMSDIINSTTYDKYESHTYDASTDHSPH